MINAIDILNIKKIILNTIPNLDLDKVILLGSRVRNDFVLENDYELLIIVNNNISKQDRIKISSELRRAFADKLIDADIILKEKSEIDFYMDKIGNAVKNALEEGIII